MKLTLYPSCITQIFFASLLALAAPTTLIARTSTNSQAAPPAQPAVLPSNADLAPMAARLTQFKRIKSNGSFYIVTFPARVGNNLIPASGPDLAQAITATMLLRAVSAKVALQLPPTPPEPDDQRALWNFARAVRDFARNKPAGPFYTLYADYSVSPRWDLGSVHLVLCDPQGEWVIVDSQTSRSPDYQAIKPVNWQGCDQVIARHLQTLLH